MVEFKYSDYKYVTPTVSRRDVKTIGQIVSLEDGKHVTYNVRRAVYKYWDQSNNLVYEVESTLIPVAKCI